LAINIYVISLPGSPRRGVFEEILKDTGLDYRIFAAVDGKSVSRPMRSAVYDRETNARVFKRPLSDGEIGCYLSHLAIWREVAASGQPALILEDDFALPSDATARFLRDLPATLAARSLIKLSSAERQKFTAGALLELHGHKIRGYRIVSPHTTGYIIGPVAAARMVQARSHFFRPVDIDIKHVWEHQVPVYGVDPPLVIERPGAVSTMDAERSATKNAAGYLRLLANTRYQVRFQFKRLRQAMTRGPEQGRPGKDEAE
jgi:glycosyl transferase, family 25